MNKRTGIVLIFVGIVAWLFLKNCGGVDSIPNIWKKETNFESIDTLSYSPPLIDESTEEQIKERVDKAVSTTENSVNDIIHKVEILQAELITVKTAPPKLIHDTIYIDPEPDSVMIYNIFEHAVSYGDETYIHIDTVQQRLVSKEYVQKYIINSPYYP